MGNRLHMKQKLFLYISAGVLAACGSSPSRTPVGIEADRSPPNSQVENLVSDKASTVVEKSENESNHGPELNERLSFYQPIEGSLASQDDKNKVELGKIQLNFVDAPAADVARAVIDRALGRGLAVSEGVTGTISLLSPEAVPVDAALRALDEVLADSGLALVETSTGFMLTTTLAASERAQSFRRADEVSLGFGVTVMPIRYTTPSEITRLIQPLLSKRVTVTSDDENSLVFLRGVHGDVQSALEAIQLFDAPQLTNKVLGLFELRHASVQDVLSDLETVYRTKGDSNLRSLRLAPLPRVNALFVAANSRYQFREVKDWIERFDKPAGIPSSGLHFYQAQHKPAPELAASLNSIFGAATEITSSAADDRQVQTKKAASSVKIIADELNNALIIRAGSKESQEILELLRQMDQYTPQVLIEATIAEVILNNDLRYGVRWFWENSNERIVSTDSPEGGVGVEYPGISYTQIGTNFRVALSALASITDVSVLSAPSIMVQNNQTANLQVGDQIPIVTQQAQSVADGDAPIVATVQLRDTGVILEVTPRINASDMVSLVINQEVSDVAATTTSGIDSPTIQQRKLSSTVSVRNGRTIALGGLIRETETDSNTGVPLLKSIPLVGNLFSSRNTSVRRTELIIFLTPRIVRNDDESFRILDLLREDMKSLSERLDRDDLLH